MFERVSAPAAPTFVEEVNSQGCQILTSLDQQGEQEA